MCFAKATAVLRKTLQSKNLGPNRSLHRTTRSVQYVAQCQLRTWYEVQ